MGTHFSSADGSRRQISEMLALGASRITLKLDQAAAERLPDSHLNHYIQACTASGIISEVRFEFSQELPEIFFALARRMEELRFYTKLYPIKVLPVRRRKFSANEYPLAFDGRPFRVVISHKGEVLLRRREREIVETQVGDLGQTQLSEAIRPERLGLRAHRDK